ncbi:hypothetical protein PRZ48_002875 [Zasmidium cellare]|uniref:Uncharacterized protein n=1 Tax=Zasmidium cellare TaxID=395010 RepID=A0ABR0ETM6_ZASCE|nr:hypothetical protein PRZ48_002875 [Zasmidium cellare]
MEQIPVPRLEDRADRPHDTLHAEPKALLTRLTAATLSTAVTIGLISIFSWASDWLYSGAAILSQLLVYDQARQTAAFPSTRPWMILAILNIIYAIASTSWLQYRIFATICWVIVLVTFVSIAPWASYASRAILRRLLTRAHLTSDVIAGFDLPALHLDIGLEGLLAVRGWTFSLWKMTLELHGVEAAYNLTEGMHICLYCDGVAVRIWRSVTIDAIYGVLKQEKFAVELESLSQPKKGTEASFDPAQETTTGDVKAHSVYQSIRHQIRHTSPIQQCRKQTGRQDSPQLDEKIRAATCKKLDRFTSVPHRPEHSIQASTILQFIPLWIRRFLSRMPFILRLILMPLSYLHPIKTASASVSASGSWMAGIMRDRAYSIHGEDRDDIKELERAMTSCMENAMFCLDLADIQALAQVSIRASQDMVAYLWCGSSTMMRIETGWNKVAPAISLEGMDATFIIPPYFLPSHEHLLPPPPSSRAGEKEQQADEADVEFSFHLSLPVVVDGAMIDFLTDFINATIAIEMEDEDTGNAEDLTDKSRIDRTKIKITAAAHGAGGSIKKGIKKAAFSTTNDSWIPKLVNGLASQLEGLHGHVGYSGRLPVSLQHFRGDGKLPTKLLA